MEDNIVKEALDVFKELSKKNQDYFLSMIKLAKAAEDGIKEKIKKDVEDRASWGGEDGKWTV